MKLQTGPPSFLGVKLERWSGEKKEIVIEDCEPEVLDIVVNYVYGIEIPNQVLTVMKVTIVSDSALRSGIVLACAKFLTSLKCSLCPTSRNAWKT